MPRIVSLFIDILCVIVLGLIDSEKVRKLWSILQQLENVTPQTIETEKTSLREKEEKEKEEQEEREKAKKRETEHNAEKRFEKCDLQEFYFVYFVCWELLVFMSVELQRKRKHTMPSGETSHARVQSSVGIQGEMSFQGQRQQQGSPQAGGIPMVASVVQMPVPGPGMVGSPYFNGTNVSRFLDNFRVMTTSHGVDDRRAMEILPLYCEINQQGQVESIIKQAEGDWKKLRTLMRQNYWREDQQQQLYSRTYLTKLSKEKQGREHDILSYCHRFAAIARELLQNRTLDQYTAAWIFLDGLPNSMQSYVMKKNHVNIENPDTMNFDRLLKFTIESQHEEESVRRFRGEATSTTMPSILSQGRAVQDPTIVHNPNVNVGVGANIAWPQSEPLSTSQLGSNVQTNNPVRTQEDTLTELTKKMDALTLLVTGGQQQVRGQTSAPIPNVSYVSSGERQQSSLPGIIPSSAGQPLYGNARGNRGGMNRGGYGMTYGRKRQCYACGQPDHIAPNCGALAALIGAGKVHRAPYGDWFVGPEGDPRQIRIPISGENLWVDEIKSFLQKMENAQRSVNNNNPSQQQSMRVEQPVRQSSQVDSVTICAVGEEDDVSDEEYKSEKDESPHVDAALPEKPRRGRPPLKDKNRQALDSRIEKEKAYPTAHTRIPGEYVKQSQHARFQEYPVNEKGEVSVEPIENVDSREETMEDAPQTVVKTVLKRPPKEKGPKLAKELKDKDLTSEIAQKIFRTVMGQPVDGITVADLLGTSPLLHQMMFQNLPKGYGSGKGTQVKDIDGGAGASTPAVQSVEYDPRSELFSVGQLRFPMRVGRREVESTLDDGAEINCILHSVALSLGLVIETDVRVHMQTAGGHRSGLIGICREVPVTVGTVTVYQNFFVLEKGTAECLLGRPYENATRMAKKTQNDGSVHITVFDPRDDANQVTFQPYTPGDSGDRTLQELVDGSEGLK